MAPQFSRRGSLGLLAAGGLAHLPARAEAATGEVDRAEWATFRERFLLPDGRVVDSGNRNVSHTEGQGWAMLMAVRADDRGNFDRILGWTRRTLKRPRDNLHVWRYQPQSANPLGDPNNATDGDLFIAWALLEAAERWNQPEHRALAEAIGRDVLRLTVRRVGGFTVLLPGARGFERRDHVILNPSYYAFPALRVLARGVPDPAWLHVAADGLALLRRARFGRWGLPPDWLALARSDGRLSLPNGYAPRFSYDAVRVPLYLAWSGLTGEPGLTSAAAFWADPGHGHLPAWTDLTNNAVSPYPASGGISAIARLAIRAQQGGQRETAAERPAGTAGRPAVGTAPAPDYYSAALAALARFAGHDAMQQPA